MACQEAIIIIIIIIIIVVVALRIYFPLSLVVQSHPASYYL